MPLNFTLDVGQSFSGNVFTLYTLETSVDWDDLFPQSITATFNFTLPEVFGGSVPGNTYGQSLIGIVQQGVVSWNNSGNASLAFGGGGLLNVHLEDGIFNSGFFGVDEGLGEGAHINGQFTLVSAPVPEPATWAMMISGFGLVGGALRRRHSKRLLVTA
ncbi:MAG: PEPxxWA-CTERM sorting domain-containing protein [Candidatus Moraniibacteriota bacterium]